MIVILKVFRDGSRIPHRRGANLPGGANPLGGHQHRSLPCFPKNCMKLRKFWSVGGGAVLGAPPWIRHWSSALNSCCWCLSYSDLLQYLQTLNIFFVTRLQPTTYSKGTSQYVCSNAFLLRPHCRPPKQFALTSDKLQSNYNLKINFLNHIDNESDTLMYIWKMVNIICLF